MHSSGIANRVTGALNVVSKVLMAIALVTVTGGGNSAAAADTVSASPVAAAPVTGSSSIQGSAQVSTDISTIPKKRLKVALALGGGGTRGAAHVGVLKVFEREHIPIDFIAGTSMGAVIGGMYAAGLSLNFIEDEFVGTNRLLHAYFTVELPAITGNITHCSSTTAGFH